MAIQQGKQKPASLVQWLTASPSTTATRVQSSASAYMQIGFMPYKMEVHTCYNSQLVTAASL